VAAAIGRPPVLYHRLDQKSSGILLLGKTRRFNAQMRALFDGHRLRKAYWVVVEGAWPASTNTLGGIDDDGREMKSTCRILRKGENWTLLEFLLKTGRKHQIRKQCTAIGHPVWGDGRYGARHVEKSWIALHCHELRFQHPASQQNITIDCPAPAHWRAEWAAPVREPGAK